MTTLITHYMLDTCFKLALVNMRSRRLHDGHALVWKSEDK